MLGQILLPCRTGYICKPKRGACHLYQTGTMRGRFFNTYHVIRKSKTHKVKKATRVHCPHENSGLRTILKILVRNIEPADLGMCIEFQDFYTMSSVMKGCRIYALIDKNAFLSMRASLPTMCLVPVPFSIGLICAAICLPCCATKSRN